MKQFTIILLLLLGTSLYSEESMSNSITGGDYIMTSVSSGGGNSGTMGMTTILNVITGEVFVINQPYDKTPKFYKRKLVDFEVTEKN